MRILFVSDTYYPHVNGVYYFVRRLAVLLQQEGHQVAVMVPSENTVFLETTIDNIDVYRFPSFPVVYYPKIRFPSPVLLQSNIKRLLKKLSPDVIHLQDHFTLARAVIKANGDFNIPIMGTNHFMPENVTALLPFSFLNKQLEAWIWASFSKTYNQLMLVTTPTEIGAQLIHTKLQPDVVAVSNGIDLQRFSATGSVGSVREKYAIPNKPVLLYVGRLDPEKHLKEVLYAVAKALENTDFCFVLAGKGVEREMLERLAKKLKISESVIFAGFVTDEDLPSIYRTSQCFITASIAELQSIATMEAMASGLPILAVDAGALSELVHHGENGYLFDTGDIDSIANLIRKIFSKINRGKEMGKASLAYIQTHDINKVVKEYEIIYKKVLGENPANLKGRLGENKNNNVIKY